MIIFVALTVIMGLPAFGQAASTDLDKLINGLQARYGKMKGLSADFTQHYNDRAGRRLREEGTLLLKQPGKMRWEYRLPEPKLFLADGKKAYFYVPSERQVTITPIKETDDPRTPFLFLLGRGNMRRDFKSIEISKGEAPVAAGNVVLELVPKRAINNLKLVLVEVNPQQLQLRRLTLIDAAGARSDFLLSNFRENFVPGDDQFTFTPPAGVRVLN